MWSGILISFKHFPQFVVIHTVKGFCIVNEAEVDIFLKLLNDTIALIKKSYFFP